MDELAVRVIDRMRLDASGRVATIQPGDQLTVRVANAARVPITGAVHAERGEATAGRRSRTSIFRRADSTTLSLTDCSPGTTGTGGAGGTGGAAEHPEPAEHPGQAEPRERAEPPEPPEPAVA